MNNKGLSIIELMIIVSIISLVTMIAMPNIVRVRQEAKNINIKLELKSAYTSISIYYLEKGKYPKTWEDLSLYLPIAKYINKYELNGNL